MEMSLNELEAALAAGRALVLPCKLGDPVYTFKHYQYVPGNGPVYGMCIEESKVEGLCVWGDSPDDYGIEIVTNVLDYSDTRLSLHLLDQTFFLDRDKAEAAFRRLYGEKKEGSDA